MIRVRCSGPAVSAFFAVTSAFGIVAHLVSEVAGLSWSDDSDLLTSPRHGYLAAIAGAIVVALIRLLFLMPKHHRRARLASLIEALPFRGRGPAFVALTFAAQFGFFAITQIGEGCPLCSGDVVTGVFAAAMAATLGTVIIALGKRRLLEFVIALYVFRKSSGEPTFRGASWKRERRRDAGRSRRRSAFAFRYRPPPVVFTSI
jgi:hypothetical protein